MQISRRFLSLVAALWLTLGCSSESNDEPVDLASGAPVSESAFIDAYGELVCNQLERCCAEAGYEYDGGFCALLTSGMGASEHQTYSDVQGGLCLKEAALVTSCTAEEVPACEGVFTGTLAPGAACESDGDCAAPANGTASCDMMRNVCVAELRGVEGDTCHRSCSEEADGGWWCSYNTNLDTDNLDTLGDCYKDDGLYCDPTDNLCRVLSAVGESCSGDNSCADQDYCTIFDGETESTCQPRRLVGESCDSFLTPCIDTAFCSADLCVTKKPAGESCTEFNECLGYCDCGASGDCSAGGVCAGDGGTELGELGQGLSEFLCNGNTPDA